MRKLLLLTLAAGWLLQGCLYRQPAPADKDCKKILTAAPWRLVAIDNRPVTLPKPVTLRIDTHGDLNGFGGCNRYFGHVKIFNHALHFFGVGSTRKFCRGEPGRVERALFQMLSRNRWWQLDGRRLIVFDDTHRLVFEPFHD